MYPKRETTVKGHKIEEFYWAGSMVVYVDNHLVHESYNQAIQRLLELPNA